MLYRPVTFSALSLSTHTQPQGHIIRSLSRFLSISSPVAPIYRRSFLFAASDRSSRLPAQSAAASIAASKRYYNKMTDGQELQPYASMAGRLDARLLGALKSMNYEYMSPVQELVITKLPTLQTDCLVRAKTGTGKTIAFLLPALQSLLSDRKPLPRGQVGILIISPTRELALQIAKECDNLTSKISPKLECHTAFGGTARASNLDRFMKGSPSVLVATPGRLKDYLTDHTIAAKLGNLRTLILDEADTMLEAGFLADIRTVLKALPPKASGWQGMCFSATVPPRVKEVVQVVLRPGYTELSTVVEDESPTHERVPQFHVVIPEVAQTFTALQSILHAELQSGTKAIVFGATANMVALYAKAFAQGLIDAEVYEIHSRLSQSARTKVTQQFKAAQSGVMFASDVVGRGMDFPDVDLVVQVGLPMKEDNYIHRVGRTARAGKEGRAVILLTQEESFFLRAHRELPIKPHPQTAELATAPDPNSPAAIKLRDAMYNLDDSTKQRAYSAWIGFLAGSGMLKQMRIDKAGLVERANDMAMRGMYCPEPPGMQAKVIGKMGLKGVPGFRIVKGDDAAGGGGNGGGRTMHRRPGAGNQAHGGQSSGRGTNGNAPPFGAGSAGREGTGGRHGQNPQAGGRRPANGKGPNGQGGRQGQQGRRQAAPAF